MPWQTGDEAAEFAVTGLIVAGWTGRDQAAIEHHIKELADIGVTPPSATPLFYRVSASLLTQAAEIEVLGPETSGEAEPLLIRHSGRMWLGLASDHTDRHLETTSVAASKQVCAKPCGPALWALDEVAPHLDQLVLRSWIPEEGDWRLYQDGILARIRPLSDLLARHPLNEGQAMLCGTLPALGGIRPSTAFRAELSDPVLGRSLTLEYQTRILPVIS